MKLHPLYPLALAGCVGVAQAASFDATVDSDQAEAPAAIHVTVHLPGDAGPDTGEQFPTVLYSHGWSGSRADINDGSLQKFLDSGFAVVAIDQRGHGDSSGQANVQDPDYEGQDVIAVIDYVAGSGWSLKNAGSTDDPVLFSIGGSYGGGYQWAGLLTELRDTGATRFDGIAPQITWHDLPQSLAPNGVARTLYLSGLYGVKTASDPRTLPDYVHLSYAYTMATGNVPTGPEPIPDLVTEFRSHGPSGYGLTVDVPALMRQGTTDTLFNFNQGYRNFAQILTERARKKSLFIAYNGGHGALNPTAMLLGGVPVGDPCTAVLAQGGDFTDLTIAFFTTLMAGGNPRNEIVNAAFPGSGPGKPAYHVGTDAGNCVSTDAVTHASPAVVQSRGVATIEVPGVGGGIGSATGAGVPVYTEVPDTGGLTVAGISRLTGTAYAAAAEARIFIGLAKGTSAENATLIQNQVMPVRFAGPAAGTAFEVELAGIATEIGAGEKLFLMVSAINDQFIGHGSRLPGGIILTDAVLELPVQR